jgi:hypothetical protein
MDRHIAASVAKDQIIGAARPHHGLHCAIRNRRRRQRQSAVNRYILYHDNENRDSQLEGKIFEYPETKANVQFAPSMNTRQYLCS